MASLKEFRSRIDSVNSTKRITSAMKMVAVAKLRRATSNVEFFKQYAKEVNSSACYVANQIKSENIFVHGNGNVSLHYVVLVTADRGLCGGFNTNNLKKFDAHVKDIVSNGKQVKVIGVGKKACQHISARYEEADIVFMNDAAFAPEPSQTVVQSVVDKIVSDLNFGLLGSCSVVYGEFVSAISQVAKIVNLVPFEFGDIDTTKQVNFDVDVDALAEQVLKQNIFSAIYLGMLENFASEQSARMNAMDNATRNATDMLNKLNVEYNRTRQAQVTNELIEIISGAEAL